MFKKALFLIIMINTLLSAQEERLTITTYYPSPYGSYSQLQVNSLGVGDTNQNGRLDSNDVPSGAGDVWIAGAVGIGTTDTADSTLAVRNPASSSRRFVITARNMFVPTTTANESIGIAAQSYEGIPEARGILARAWRSNTGDIWKMGVNGYAYPGAYNFAGYFQGKVAIVNSSSGSGDARLGIGIVFPQEALHVMGRVKIQDGNEGRDKVLTSNEYGTASWQPAKKVDTNYPTGTYVWCYYDEGRGNDFCVCSRNGILEKFYLTLIRSRGSHYLGNNAPCP